MSLQGKQTLHHAPVSPASSGDELPVCWQRDRQPACLRVELASGEIYVLPYQHFVAAHLSRANGVDRLNISFSTHEISIEGAKLRELAIALSELSVAFMAEVPARYQRSTSGSAITAIHVALVE
jgi:hypothetical protein